MNVVIFVFSFHNKESCRSVAPEKLPEIEHLKTDIKRSFSSQNKEKILTKFIRILEHSVLRAVALAPS